MSKELIERLKTVVESLEAGVDDWPLPSQIYEYHAAINTIEQLHEQLAASLLREVKLREALQEGADQLRLTNDNLRKGMSKSIQRLQASSNRDALAIMMEALSQPSDDTALHEMIHKAGEVMRWRCIVVSQDEMDEQFVGSDPWYSARSCRDSIRALSGVTLDDLKGGV